MGGMKIGIGIGIKYQSGAVSASGYIPPSYLSCYGTGVWENEGYWFNSETWKYESTNPPFLSTGVWNYEGTYRYKDKISLGMSFLSTGYFRYSDIYRYADKIKVEKDIKNAILTENENYIATEDSNSYLRMEGKAVKKSYWNL